MTYDLGQIAAEAITEVGGPVKAAKVLTRISGRRISRDVLQKWKERGINPWWLYWFESISDKSARQLRPDMFEGP